MLFDAKRIYLASACIGVIASFAFALFAEGFWTAMLFRFVSGVSLAGTYMPGLQILNERLEEKQRLKAVPWYTGRLRSWLRRFVLSDGSTCWESRLAGDFFSCRYLASRLCFHRVGGGSVQA